MVLTGQLIGMAHTAGLTFSSNEFTRKSLFSGSFAWTSVSFSVFFSLQLISQVSHSFPTQESPVNVPSSAQSE